MTVYLSEIMNTSYTLCETVQKWMKDVALVIEKVGLSDNTKRILCKEIHNNVEEIIMKLDEELNVLNNRIMKIFIEDIKKLVNMLDGYIVIFVENLNLPECINQPDYKRELIYVLLGSLSMINDNLYVYRVSNAKYLASGNI